jgi:hypothetical protein
MNDTEAHGLADTVSVYSEVLKLEEPAGTGLSSDHSTGATGSRCRKKSEHASCGSH